MLRITLKLLFIFLYTFSYAQEKNIIVDYTLNKRNRITDTVRIQKNYKLFIENDKSYFVSLDKIKKDSISNEIKNSNANALHSGFSFNIFKIFEIIEYQYSNQKINVYEFLVKNPMYYSEPLEIKWKLTNENKKIGDIKCQLAETKIYGRKWFAWYTMDFAFHEGPYKFKGLPGLILEVYDENKDFIFTTDRIYKGNDRYNLNTSKFKKINKNQWKSIKQTYIENPFPEITKKLNSQTKESLRRASIENSKNILEIE